MKKYLFTVLAVMSMLVMRVGSAAAASASITLINVEHSYKGPVFTFRVSGKFSKAELKGSLHVENGADYTLYCTQVDETTVKCTTSDKVSGVNVVVTWGGSTYWASVPEAPPQYCYSIYDWSPPPPPFVGWVNYGAHCQHSPATYGDIFTWYNPGWEDTYDYIFLPESPTAEWCSFYQAGDGYYFPVCPPSIPL